MKPTLLVRRSGRIVLAALLLLIALPATAAAHAELEASTPKDGATVQGTPAEVAGRYSEAMDPDGSSLKLEAADGTTVATGGVEADNDERMSITNLPDLAPGVYTVRSTTKSAEDGDIDRKTWSFTVAAGATASPTEAPTPAPTATPVASSAAPSASVEPSATATPATSATPVPSTSPTPSASGGGTPTGSGGDVILPIIAAVLILVVGAIWFSRRGRTSPGA